MPSLVPGYEYDIFISYRQKDNRYDGWVTEFVQNLRKELDATLKEGVSIYFDENPHDGLLETHHVEESLKRKLRCMIFIPILSRTYCDPKSYAWNNEFLVFRDQSRSDELGPTITLRNGNAASRILPIRIHELDDQDKVLFEKETGSPLRAVDFVFRSPGVNRPLRAKDDEVKEISHSLFYRDQINKVANAVGEILAGAAATGESGGQELAPGKRQITKKDGLKKQRLFLSLTAFLLLVAAAFGIFRYPGWLNSKQELSVVVLPFKNLSADPKDAYLADGLQEELIARLAGFRQLLVIAPESAREAVRAELSPSEISRRLGARYIVTGSVAKTGDDLRITTLLKEGETGKIVATKTLDRKAIDYRDLMNEVTSRVVGDFGIAISGGFELNQLPSNIKAFEYLREAGRYPIVAGTGESRKKRIEYLKLALKEDSMYLNAWYGVEFANLLFYGNEGDSTNLREALAALDRINTIDKDSHIAKHANMLYAYWILKDFNGVIRKCNEILDAVPSDREAMFRKGIALRRLGKGQEALETYLDGLKIDPLSIGFKRDIVQLLLAHNQTEESGKFVESLRNPWQINDYYLFSFESKRYIEDFAALDSLAVIASRDTGRQINPVIRGMVTRLRKSIVPTYKRDYSSALAGVQLVNPAYDSALTHFLMKDTASAKRAFSRLRNRQLRNLIRAVGPSASLSARTTMAVAMAGLAIPNWETEFENSVGELDAMVGTIWYHQYVVACIVAGKNEKAITLLRECIESGAELPAIGPGPFGVLTKNQPLLDPLRDKPGFEELWDGNHLKIKPLKLPKEWR
jgi:TolB-like protein